MEELDDLEVADGNVNTVFILTKDVGGMNVILSSENTIYKNYQKRLQTYLQRVGGRP